MVGLTRTVLVADVVGSTELFTSLGSDGADDLRRALFAMFGRTTRESGGSLVKTMGDGCLASFESAAAAVSASTLMQIGASRIKRARRVAVALRVGLAVGDVTVEDGDIFGEAVVVASRLCAEAAVGQSLATDVVRALAGDRGGHLYRRVGEMVLKGIASPVPVSSVAWEDAEEATRPLPEVLAGGPGELLVGRARERALLSAAWKRAVAGDRQVVLVGGEPGIGKTRLVAELGRTAHVQGGVVLFGRCEEDLAAPYQPFSNALLPAVAEADVALLEAHIAACGGELSRLVPDLGKRVSYLPEPVDADPATSQLRLYDAVVDLLRRVSATGPVVLIVDDLHWAAASTIALHRHIVGAANMGPLLVIATFRDSDADRTEALTGLLADLHRIQAVERLSLTGLDTAEMEELLTVASGDDLDEAGRTFAESLVQRTGGNPFFAGQILRHLVERGGLLQENGRWVAAVSLDAHDLPGGVVDVVSHRVDRLAASAKAVLAAAAVMGPDPTLAVLRRIPDVGGETERLVDSLDDSVRARLLSETGPGRYTFTHAIVRDVLLAGLTRTQRARLHRGIGHALVSLYGDDPGPHLAQLALHFTAAAPLGDVRSAARYAVAAAEDALSRADPEGAIAVLRAALPAVEAVEPADHRARFEVFVSLAQAYLLIYSLEAREWVIKAAESARILGDAMLLLDAASMSMSRVAGADNVDVMAMLDEAVAGLPDPSPELAYGIAGRAYYLNMQGVASGEPESAVAMQMARAYSDTEPALVAHVRNLRAVTLMGKPDIAERLELLDACVAVAPEVWERDRRTRRGSQTVHALRGLARMAAGDRDGFEADHAESELVVERTGSRLGLGYVMQSRVMIAFLEGDFDAVPALAGAVVNAVPDQPNFQLGMQAHLMWLCFETGRYAEILPLLEPMAAANPRLVALRACLATTQAAVGDADAATSVLASLVEEFEALPRTWLWTPVPFLMAEAAARIGDQVTAAVVLGELDLFAGQVCVFQVATALGAFDRARGMAMLTLGRAEDAVAALEAAVRLEAGLRSEPLVARSRYWLARALASGPQRDLTRAATEASLSLEVAQRLGMSELAAVAGALASNGTS